MIENIFYAIMFLVLATAVGMQYYELYIKIKKMELKWRLVNDG